MALVLNIYKKGDTQPTFSGNDTDGAPITGLPAGTVIADGDYQASHTDSDGLLTESSKVDVPGFTVNKAQAPAPTNVTVTATDDGAVVKASTE